MTMIKPVARWIKVLIVLMMATAVGCVVVLSMHRPGSRISIMHDYWSQARVDTAATVASLDAARRDPQTALPARQFTTVDRISLGDRSLKSRFDLLLSDTGTFTASRTTSIGRDRDDRVSVKGRYRVAGHVIEFTPQEGPIGLYPVDGASLVTVREDGSMALEAGDHSIVLQRVVDR